MSNNDTHQIDYLRFTYSPEYANQATRNMGFLEKLGHAMHIALTIQPEIEFEDWKEKGMHGFTHSARAYRDGQTVGYVAAGGNHGKVLVDLSGGGCIGVPWGEAYKLLDQIGARLTRVDVCIDDMEGVHSVHEVRKAYKTGEFDKRGQRPTSELRGPWDTNDLRGEGLSYYVGKPANGLQYVAYEKGKQLGDSMSPWVRHEIRFGKTSKKLIPLEILLDPYEYARIAYKYLEWVESFEPVAATHIHIEKQKIMLTDLVHWAKQSYGKLVNVLQKVGHSPEQIIKLLRTGGSPDRLLLRDQDYGRLILT